MRLLKYTTIFLSVSIMLLFSLKVNSSVLKPINKKLDRYTWGQWKTTSCYKGINYRIKRDDHYEGKWFIEFSNRYVSEVSMDVEVVNAGSPVRIHIPSGDTRKEYFYLKDKRANEINFYINKLKFDDRSWGGPYAECDH